MSNAEALRILGERVPPHRKSFWHAQAALIDPSSIDYQVFFRVLHETGLRGAAILALALHCRRDALLEAQCVLAMNAQPRWSEYFVRCDAELDKIRKGQ